MLLLFISVISCIVILQIEYTGINHILLVFVLTFGITEDEKYILINCELVNKDKEELFVFDQYFASGLTLFSV